MHRLSHKAALIFSVFSLSACAHLVNVLDNVRVGMDREQAVGSAKGSPTPYYLKGEPTEYVLFRVVTNFNSMYGEHPNDILFIRLENGRVVDKGVVGTSEEERIKKISPTFVLRDWQGKGHVLSDETHKR